jgi:hypothetical protein
MCAAQYIRDNQQLLVTNNIVVIGQSKDETREHEKDAKPTQASKENAKNMFL